MSIVTDALNRLQSMRAQVVSPTAAHDPASSQSEETEPQDDQLDSSTSDRKFLTVSIGSFLVIATMAMGAFWWGESVVSEVPMLASSPRSFRDVKPPEPVDEKTLDSTVPDQSTVVTAEANIELSPAGQETDFPSSEAEELEISKDLKQKNSELVVSLSSQAEAEPFLVSPEDMEDGSASGEQESGPLETTEPQESAGLSPAGVSDSPVLTKRETVSMTPSGSVDQDQLSQPRVPDSMKTKEKSESDAVPPVANVEIARMTRDSSSHSSSPLPSLAAKNPRTSSRTSPSQIQSSEGKAQASVSQAQNRLSPEQRLLKARLLIEQQSHAEALMILSPLFATLPHTWEPWYWMGTAQLGIGNLDKAENAFMEGLVRNDTVPSLWVQRAVIEQQRGRYRSAMDALRQAELLDPDLPEVQLNLAYNLEHQGNPKLAHRHYQRYLALTEGQSIYHAVRRKVLERVMHMGNS